MTTPIDPDNSGALAKIAENGMAYGMDRGMGGAAIAAYVANAVARSVCPPGYSVVADDDLRDVIEAIRHCRNVLAVGEWPDLDQATIDTIFRWKAAIGEQG